MTAPQEPLVPVHSAESAERLPFGISPRNLAVVEILLILMVFFIHAGWKVPEVNEPHYLGKAKHYWNPNWCQGDFFLGSADAHQTFYWCFGWLTLLLPLPIVGWIGRILTWTLLATAWRRLSFLVLPKPLTSVLSAALFVTLLDQYNLAGEWVVGGIEAKGFAYALVIFALAEMICGRWNRVWFLLGAASAWHVLVGGWSVLAAGLVFLFEGKKRPPVLTQWKGLLAGGLLAMVGLLPALLLTKGIKPETVTAANEIYVFGRLPHHLALHTLKDPELHKRLTRNLYPLLSFIALVALLPRSLSKKRIGLFVSATIIMSLIGAAISLLWKNNPEQAAGLLRYYWYRLYDFALPMGVSLLAIGLMAELFLRRRRKLGVLFLLVLLLISGVGLGKTAMRRFKDPRPPADRKMHDAPDWYAACNWADENTPLDARFFTPRGSHTFKWYANRSEVVNHKDIPQDSPSIVEWQERIDDLYPIKEDERGKHRTSLSRQPVEELLRLSKKYGANFLITPKSVPLPFPQIYQNNTYVIYKLIPDAKPLSPAGATETDAASSAQP